MKSSGEYDPGPKTRMCEPVAEKTGVKEGFQGFSGPGPHDVSRRNRAIASSPRQSEQRDRLQGQFESVMQRRENKTGMPDEIKAGMEKHFDADFSSVRVHSDSSKAGEIGALAYTQGDNVHFAAGQYQPARPRGRQLLGHELAHVVQQREGRVAATGEIDGMALNDDSALEREADMMGKKA